MITLSLHYTQPPLHSAYGLQFHGTHVNMVSVCRVVCNIDSFAIGIPAARPGPESVAVAVLSPVLEFSTIFRVLSGDRVAIGWGSGGPVLDFSTISGGDPIHLLDPLNRSETISGRTS